MIADHSPRTTTTTPGSALPAAAHLTDNDMGFTKPQVTVKSKRRGRNLPSAWPARVVPTFVPTTPGHHTDSGALGGRSDRETPDSSVLHGRQITRRTQLDRFLNRRP